MKDKYDKDKILIKGIQDVDDIIEKSNNISYQILR